MRLPDSWKGPYWEPRDIWVGLYWDSRVKPRVVAVNGDRWDESYRETHAYICLAPCFPIRLTWVEHLAAPPTTPGDGTEEA